MAEPEEIPLTEELQRLAQADPFTPFVIIMASGERYEIGEADTLVLGRHVISLFSYRKAWYLLRPNQISEIAVPGGSP